MEFTGLNACTCVCFFYQAEDGIRDAPESRGLGDVYKRQEQRTPRLLLFLPPPRAYAFPITGKCCRSYDCLLYTSDAVDDLPCVDLVGRRLLKKKKKQCKSYPDILDILEL